MTILRFVAPSQMLEQFMILGLLAPSTQCLDSFDLRSANIAGRMPETGKVAKMPANSGIQKSNSSHLSHCDSVGHALSVIINSVAKGKPVKWINNFVRNIEVII